ncbi:kynureninase-like isoform X2 [Gigantopelta aegis]|nr:kynureninase-like isoform X2 [Gigantopelta aegis]XP_041360764.1 kynureninase-like isoform X2 [Gigantopelta aegis]XP_041360765.1 kynureninase-like isoform X2 [Gigantopelta aegis]
MAANVHPADELNKIANKLGCDVTDLEFANYMDEHDELRHLRNDFFYPKMKDLSRTDESLVDPEEDCMYFCSYSVGLCPKTTEQYVKVELAKWSKQAVEGYFEGDLPWALCDERLDQKLANIVGGKKGEVAIMNALTVNLHLLLISFYQPTESRYKIMCEGKAFPSDHYTFQSQIRLHGFDPDTSLLCLEPREGEVTLRTEDILKKIDEEGDSIAVICLPGVQFYTGQFFDVPTITKAGQAKGCYVGWDLAHAVGNVPLALHDWGVDFACWCSNKYLCASAGGVAGAFLHEKHSLNDFPKLLGWWGHHVDTRFNMDNKMDLSPGIYGYRISSPASLLSPPLKASLEIFNKTTMEDLRKKSKLLTGYLELLINTKYKRPTDTSKSAQDEAYIDVLSPVDPEQRGAQLSLKFSVDIHVVCEELVKRGAVCDVRLSHAIRVAPAPLYCSFQDVHRFMKCLDKSIAVAIAQKSVS